MQSLALGTAQWGTSYGVTNAQGRLTDAVVGSIIAAARAAGITELDTAGAYGDAEARLRPWAGEFAVTTKVLGADPASIPRQLAASLGHLGVDRVQSCLLHDWSILDAGQAAQAVQELRRLQESGMVEIVGVSAYDEPDIERAIEAFETLDALQVPANVLDQRLAESSILVDLAERGARIQVRSVFLQGLLATRSSTLLGLHPAVARFHDWCEARGRDPREVSLAFARSLPWVTSVVVGVTSGEELAQVAAAWIGGGADPGFATLATDDTALIDPRSWA